MKNKIRVLGIIALVAIIGFSMAGCPTGNENNSTPDIPAPKSNVTALSGVTEDGEIIELVNTTQTSGRAGITATGWKDGDGYKAFLNGAVKSTGTVTVENGQITKFSDTNESNIKIDGDKLSVGGKSATVSAPADDEYYCFIFNNPGSKEGSDFINSLAGKSADQAFDAILKNNIAHITEWEEYKKDNPY